MQSLTFKEINRILGREHLAALVTTAVRSPQAGKNIYIYGPPGTGKTRFAEEILKECGYEVVTYDVGAVCNKAAMDEIVRMGTMNGHYKVWDMMREEGERTRKPVAIVLDDMDSIRSSGDKGGINALFALIRGGAITGGLSRPIICTGGYYMDKKIKDIRRCCQVFELSAPSNAACMSVMRSCCYGAAISADMEQIIAPYVQGDLRKVAQMGQLLERCPALVSGADFLEYFKYKTYNETTKGIVAGLLCGSGCNTIANHAVLMGETDRTSVGLLWHENVIDYLPHRGSRCDTLCGSGLDTYMGQLRNICFADNVDKLTFQHQIWQFNEMSSLIKIMKNAREFHQGANGSQINKPTTDDIRFTKILTKYSTEYNNFLFIQRLCQQFKMDKKDLIAYFYELMFLSDEVKTAKLDAIYATYGVNKLDVQRLYRYINKYAVATLSSIDPSGSDEADEGDVIIDEVAGLVDFRA